MTSLKTFLMVMFVKSVFYRIFATFKLFCHKVERTLHNFSVKSCLHEGYTNITVCTSVQCPVIGIATPHIVAGLNSGKGTPFFSCRLFKYCTNE
jgi:hypothetical protein